MQKIRKVTLALCCAALCQTANAADYFQIGLGGASVGFVGSSSLSSTSTHDDTNKAALKIGGASTTQNMYITGGLTVIGFEGQDKIYTLDLATHFFAAPSFYVGGVIGYQEYEYDNASMMSSIGATSSKFDFNGLTAGISVGGLLFYDNVDVNLTYRFVNGRSASITSATGSADIEIERIVQLSISRNIML